MTATYSRAWAGLVVAGEPVVVPYRVYNPVPPPHLASGLSRTERDVTAAIYSRHHDGHVRERALRALAPAARQSGPRTRKPKKGQGDAYLKGYCTQAANGAARTETFLGERLRRLSRRLGGNRAKCAVARSILVIVWHLLSDPEARFADLGPDWHDRKADRDRKTRAHLRGLQALGFDVTITPAA